MTCFAPGDRVLISKQRATVRYVGPVEGYDGVWVGVEWDDPSRGKHDGATGGRRYFSCCSNVATAASFVRLNKVSSGTTLVDALVLRYTNQQAEGHTGGAAVQQPYVSTASNRKLWVELVGQEQVTARQSKLELLTSARLVGANVSTVGAAGQLAGTAPCLKQLDLTDNLISNWDAAADTCQQLPGLQLLNLSLNRLQLPDHLPDAGLQLLPGLQCLVLNQCNITWQQVAVLQSALPHLQELHLAGNGISSLHIETDHASQQQQQQQQPSGEGSWPPLVGFQSLQVLGLEGNAISSWHEVLRLAGLPRLQRLALSANPISSITYPHNNISLAALFSSSPPSGSECISQQIQQGSSRSTDTSTGPAAAGAGPAQPPAFNHLTALLLGDCRISSWADVDQLNKFPALRELRLTGNPLFSADAAGSSTGRRWEVIGRVAGLTLLNGADVKPRERRDCELRYLQNVLGEVVDAQAAGSRQQHQQQAGSDAQAHPRLLELQAKYGQVSAVGPATGGQQQGSTLGSATCELLLQCGSTALKKKLPRTITVAALKLLCSRLFKLAPEQVQLQLQGPAPDSQAGAVGTETLQSVEENIGLDETKQLSYWDITDGYKILVNSVDAEQQRQQREAEQQARQKHHETRELQQLQQGERLRTAAERS